MRRIFKTALALGLILSMASIAFAQKGSVEVRGHIGSLWFHVTYHANGGSGSYDGPDVMAGDTGTVCSLLETGIARSNYRFTGWNTRQDGDGISYKAGDRITLDSNITLYAQWKELVKRNGNRSTSVDRRRPPGDGWKLPNGDAATSNGDSIPTDDGTVTPTSDTAASNPFTGDRNSSPLYSSSLCISLAVIAFLLWMERQKKRQ